MFLTELFESKTDYSTLIPIIKKNCSEYLKEVGKNVLIRGIQSSNDVLSLAEITNRAPKDTYEGVHDYMVDFYKKENIKARRDNSLFCTGIKNTALEYGNLFVVFPYNGYDYSYLEGIKDFTRSPLYSAINTGVRLSKPVDEQIKLFDLKPMVIKTDNILHAMQNGFEICLRAPKYICIKLDVYNLHIKKELFGIHTEHEDLIDFLISLPKNANPEYINKKLAVFDAETFINNYKTLGYVLRELKEKTDLSRIKINLENCNRHTVESMYYYIQYIDFFLNNLPLVTFFDFELGKDEGEDYEIIKKYIKMNNLSQKTVTYSLNTNIVK